MTRATCTDTASTVAAASYGVQICRERAAPGIRLDANGKARHTRPDARAFDRARDELQLQRPRLNYKGNCSGPQPGSVVCTTTHAQRSCTITVLKPPPPKPARGPLKNVLGKVVVEWQALSQRRASKRRFLLSLSLRLLLPTSPSPRAISQSSPESNTLAGLSLDTAVSATSSQTSLASQHHPPRRPAGLHAGIELFCMYTANRLDSSITFSSFSRPLPPRNHCRIQCVLRQPPQSAPLASLIRRRPGPC